MKRRTSAPPRRNRRLTLAAENIDMALRAVRSNRLRSSLTIAIIALTLAAENIDMALRAVRSNRLRSSLTIAIIALGITSLVGILTAVDSMDATLKDAYSRMGAGIINIRSLYSMPADMRRIRNSREIYPGHRPSASPTTTAPPRQSPSSPPSSPAPGPRQDRSAPIPRPTSSPPTATI